VRLKSSKYGRRQRFGRKTNNPKKKLIYGICKFYTSNIIYAGTIKKTSILKIILL
jgi:hypothetical protein